MKRLLFFTILVIIAGCAQMVAPTGGPIDKTPPVLDTLTSSPLVQTDFTGRELHFTFDEFVVVKNPLQELIISPPLEHLPSLVAHRKTVTLTLNDEDTLRKNTTYSIQFNNAIQDFTEGNSAEDLTLVFSTGSTIDSNELKVKVIDNITGDPIEGAHVMLYKNLADSAVYREKPYYATETNSAGIALLRYLHAGTYHLFALMDENANLFYDLPTEHIGFRDQPITIPTDVTYTLKLFEPIQRTVLMDNSCEPYGKCEFVFNKSPEMYSIQADSAAAILASYHKEKSIIIWRSPSARHIRFYLDSAGTRIDTVSVKMKAFDESQYDKKQFLSDKLRKRTVEINPFKGAMLPIGRPVNVINRDSITVTDTAGHKINFNIILDSLDCTILHIGMKKAGEYAVKFLPGALVDVYGKSLPDTVKLDVKVLSEDVLSTLLISVDSLDKQKQYIFRLLKGEQIIAEDIISERDSILLKYRGMKAQNYTMKLIIDENKNGKYDKGSYAIKQQPETIVIKEIQGMRTGWDFKAGIQAMNNTEE